MSESAKNVIWALAVTTLLAIATKVGGGDADAVAYVALFFAVKTRFDMETSTSPKVSVVEG